MRTRRTRKTDTMEAEDWMQRKWRPMMAILYMVVCAFDFIAFPIMWSVLQAISKGQVTSEWQPLTLQGAGLFHLAMGAVLGIAAYGRSQEKIVGVTGNFPLSGFGPGIGTVYNPPTAVAPAPTAPTNINVSAGFNNPSTSGFPNSSGFSSQPVSTPIIQPASLADIPAPRHSIILPVGKPGPEPQPIL